MNFPQCVYNDDTVNGFENCEYKIIHSLEEFLKLPSNWGKSQRDELRREGFDLSSDDSELDELDGETESSDDNAVMMPRKRGRPPKIRE